MVFFAAENKSNAVDGSLTWTVSSRGTAAISEIRDAVIYAPGGLDAGRDSPSLLT